MAIGLIIAFKAMAYEETNYQVVKTNKLYEIRKYSDRLAVETVTSNQNSGFRKLFNYISGKNQTNEEIKMTTPVTEMERKGNMTMQFYLPLKYDKNNVPIPSRPDVEIVNIEGGYFAVIRYSGRSSDRNFMKHKEIFTSWKECVLTAHQESINLIKAQPAGYVDENGIYVKFYCDKII